MKKRQKKKDWKRSSSRRKQSVQRGSPLRGNLLKPKFINKPISSHEILKWMKYLKIKNFNGVFSRDQIQYQIKKGYYVINLDDSYGPGTHWVVLYLKPDIIEFFDSFGLICPEEVIHLSNIVGLNYIYNSTQYQNLISVLCGYYCIYFINKSHKGKQYYDVIKPFSHRDTEYNEQLIKNYFKTI